MSAKTEKEFSATQLAAAACTKIAPQFKGPPEVKLCFAVICLAIEDLAKGIGVNEKLEENAELMSDASLYSGTKEASKKMKKLYGTAVRLKVLRSMADSAKHYLTGNILHADLCGVDSEWIRSVIRRAGLPI